jgi:hypothetical protein
MVVGTHMIFIFVNLSDLTKIMLRFITKLFYIIMRYA